VSEIIEAIVIFVHDLIVSLGYPGVFLLMVFEHVVPPFPSELIMPFAGFVAGEGLLSYAGVLLAGTLGASTGSFIQYYLGRKLGHDRVMEFVCTYGKYFLLSGKDIERASDSFARRGKIAILLGHNIPGVRSLISIPAGMERIDLKYFIPFTLLGTFIYTLILSGAGFLMGRNWVRVLDFLEVYQNVILIIVGALIAFFIVKRLRKKVDSSDGCQERR
jgi:membrane protein DedA with SNARE-associated domain